MFVSWSLRQWLTAVPCFVPTPPTTCESANDHKLIYNKIIRLNKKNLPGGGARVRATRKTLWGWCKITNNNSDK